ncbi:MAG: isoprenylcysteine carboxylmethyltransferase family protein [Bdellovibrionota bacterium]
MSTHKKQNIKQASIKLILLFQFIGTTFVAIAPILDGSLTLDKFFHDITFSKEVAIIVMAIGGFLVASATLMMGKNFAVKPVPRSKAKLVIRWPFSFIRNPVYDGVFLLSGGWALLCRSWLAAIATSVLIVILYRKVLIEEYFLRHKFGQAYIDYTKKVGRFFPKLHAKSRINSSAF